MFLALQSYAGRRQTIITIVLTTLENEETETACHFTLILEDCQSTLLASIENACAGTHAPGLVGLLDRFFFLATHTYRRWFGAGSDPAPPFVI